MDEKKKFEMWRRNCGYITEDAKGIFWECWQAAQDAVTRSAGDGEYICLSWGGHNIRGNRDSVEAVKSAIHQAGTVPELKDEIAALLKRIAGEGREPSAWYDRETERIKLLATGELPPTGDTVVPLYEALSLTDEQIQSMWNDACQDGPGRPGWSRHIRFARALLAAPPESRQVVASGETLTMWRAICEEAECIVNSGKKYLMLTEEMCVRLGSAIEDAAPSASAQQAEPVGNVDCGECPNVTSGCRGKCMKAAAPAPAEPPADQDAALFAWATFDGEGSYDLRLFEENESYRRDYISRNGAKYADWVIPLYRMTPPPSGT